MRTFSGTISIIASCLIIQSAALADNPPLETVTAPFTGGPVAVTTTNTYSGQVWLCVTGVGQAAGASLSDAFYVFSDGANILPPPGVIGTAEPNPWHSLTTFNFVLSINNQHAEDFILPIIPRIGPNVPLYNPAHVYAFPINAPEGQLSFGVGDVFTVDNTGAYTVTVGSEADAFSCYIDDVRAEINDGHESGAITLSVNSLLAKLNNAESKIKLGKYRTANNQLRALVNEIQDQSGEQIDQTLADELIGKINYLIGLISSLSS